MRLKPTISIRQVHPVKTIIQTIGVSIVCLIIWIQNTVLTDHQNFIELLTEQQISLQTYNDSILEVKTTPDTIITPQYLHTVTGTKYQPVAAQCDSTPLHTADGSYIEIDKLKTGETRWCALSRDLLWFRGGKFRYGDSLYVHCKHPIINGWWEVHDCMNARYTNRIDFLQWHDNLINGHNRNLIISDKKINVYGE